MSNEISGVATALNRISISSHLEQDMEYTVKILELVKRRCNIFQTPNSVSLCLHYKHIVLLCTQTLL